MTGKLQASACAAVADMASGSSIAVGGFGLCGVPVDLIDASHKRGVGGLAVFSNNCRTDGAGLGLLLEDRQISKTARHESR